MQIQAITGLPARRRQVDELTARLGFLPQTMAAQSQAAYNEASIENMEANRELEQRAFGLQEQRFAQDKRQAAYQREQTSRVYDLQEEAEKRQMGIQAGGLGFSILTGDLGKNMTMGSIFGKSGGTSSASPTSDDWYLRHQRPTTGSSFWSTPIAPTIAGGLMGFGGGAVLGGKNKFKRAAIGAGIGGLASYFGSGGNWYSAAGGGLIGGLGGLF